MSAAAAPGEQASPEYRLRVGVRPEDIDALGHVSNLVYVRWVQDAAIGHSIAAGWNHAALVEAGHVFVVRRHELDYLASALAGDQVELVTWVASWTAATSLRETRVLRSGDGRELLRARTTWALVSVESGRPMRIPRGLIDDFHRPLAAG